MSISRLLIPAGLLSLVLSVAPVAKAEVVTAAQGGFSVRISVEIAAPAQRVYDSMVDAVGSWWNSSHTYSGSARNLSIDAVPGGCFCERWGQESGVQHMTVVYADPGKALRLTGGMGPLQDLGVAGSMTFRLAEAAGKTNLGLTYNVGGYSADGFAKWAPVVDSVLQEQLKRLKSYIETGSPESK